MNTKECDIRYIELKNGYSDNGPAWIGRVKLSKSGGTIYFNNHAFRKSRGAFSNYIDVETGEAYWISGIKKDGNDRHWAGSGVIHIDRRVVDEYLALVGEKELSSSRFVVVDLEDKFPVERIRKLENSNKES